ncbi:hypothetical protein MBLNU457_g2417t2 [Dothideomycetes sp. NU457]
MHLDDDESTRLKNWIIKRLEDNSDADADVLADYVLALIRSDESDAQVKQTCVENLEDFLQGDTVSFVDGVFEVIRTKSYDSTSSNALTATAPSFTPAAGPGLGAPPSELDSRKRAYQDDDVTMGEAGSQYGRRGGRGNDRPMKQMRRGNDYNQRGGRGGPYAQQQQQPQMPNFDPNNPMAMAMAFQQLSQSMGLQFPGMPQLPMPMPQQPHQAKRPGQRCRNYDNKGYCTRGAACPYEHGDPIVVPGTTEEYDPNNAMIPNGGQGQQGFERGRGRGRGRGDRGSLRGGRGGRARSSLAGPNHDRSITTVVVENIPEEKFNEGDVREFFSEFGNIDEITLQDFKRLAIVKYPDYESAKKAYDSPKVIFDNRFVKVYWYRPEGLPRPRPDYQNGQNNNGPDVDMSDKRAEEQIDPVEFAKKQEEAQRQHEERLAQKQAAETQRQELEAKIKTQAEERAKLLARLAAKDKNKNGSTPEAGVSATGASEGAQSGETTDQTAALKAKLAALEAEARSIGINPDDSADPPYAGYGRGRGGFRARGGRQPRGSWRGRGAFAGARGGGVMRLDNRPKALAVVFPNSEDFNEAKDEALKQYLLFSDLMESASISTHPDRKDAAIVAFKERYKAEQFLASAGREIPHIGKCELSWVPNNQLSGAAAATVAGNSTPASSTTETGFAEPDMEMDDERQQLGRGGEYDVADDDDRWM